MRRRHSARLPAELESSLVLAPKERILADASATAGCWCVGTDAALYVGVDGGWTRLPWEQIERADWDSSTSILSLIEVTDWGQPEIPILIELVDAGRLLDLVRERITKSIAIRMFAPVQGRKGLSVVGRRSPTGEGDIVWSYVLASGLDPEDPVVVAVADRTLEQARAELAGL
jgi:hypothetical protein